MPRGERFCDFCGVKKKQRKPAGGQSLACISCFRQPTKLTAGQRECPDCPTILATRATSCVTCGWKKEDTDRKRKAVVEDEKVCPRALRAFDYRPLM
eukprot:m.63513 g.63513  ORF g.63513 m.63513 type:complete len:97 (-) comp17791_c0_seq2:148-438(-)